MTEALLEAQLQHAQSMAAAAEAQYRAWKKYIKELERQIEAAKGCSTLPA